MAVDKLVDSTQLDTDLTAVADAIRTKGGTSASLAFPSDFVSAIAAIPTGGGSGKNVQVYSGYAETNATEYTATSVSITVAKAGTYKCSWSGLRNTTGGTSGSRLYKNGTAVGSAHTSSWIRSFGQYATETLTLAKDDVLTIYARARSSTYWMVVFNLMIEEQ